RLDVHVSRPFQQPFSHPFFYFRLGQPPGIWIQAAEQDEADVGITSFDSPCRLGVLDNALLAQQAGGEQERQWLHTWWEWPPFVKINADTTQLDGLVLIDDSLLHKLGNVVIIEEEYSFCSLECGTVKSAHDPAQHDTPPRLFCSRLSEHVAQAFDQSVTARNTRQPSGDRPVNYRLDEIAQRGIGPDAAQQV